MTATIRGFIERYLKSLLATVCVIGSISVAHAQTGYITGQVGSITALAAGAGAPNSYDFRVTLVGGPVICNGQNFAFLNEPDANYVAIVANVLSARAMGVPVTLIWTQTPTGYCQIDYMTW
jgi:hypothetical protein